MKKIITAVFIIVFFASCKEGPYTPGEPTIYNEGVIMGPYLQGVTQESVYASVECDSEEPVFAEYGLTDAYGSSAEAESVEATGSGTFIHNIRLTGLSANNYYHYRLTRNARFSRDYVFKSAVAEGTPFRFAWASDFHQGTAVHNSVAYRIKNVGTDFCLYGGDIADTGEYEIIKSGFFINSELDLLSGVPFMYTIGNHERWNPVTAAFYQKPYGAPGTDRYYSFDYGDMHVLVLDCTGDFSSGGSQYAFAQADLAATAKKWKIVSIHHPAYWGMEIDAVDFDKAGLRAMVTDIFEPAGVQAVFSGHIHYYMHSVKNGIHHMVIATAGGALNPLLTDQYTISAQMTYCYALMDVDAVSMTVNVYDENGNLVDGFVLN